MTETFRGIVKWFSNQKGYGFICREPEGDEIFVHFREIKSDGYRTLLEGQLVEFSIIERDEGIAATQVTILNMP